MKIIISSKSYYIFIINKCGYLTIVYIRVKNKIKRLRIEKIITYACVFISRPEMILIY